MSKNIDKRWLYLEALRMKVKTKLKGDPSLKLTADDILELEVKLKLSRATVERFFGLASTKKSTYPNTTTRDKFAAYVGYKNFNEFFKSFIKSLGSTS